MNSFKNLKLKAVYDSNDDISEFYNQVLSISTSYKRASGYFSHKLLKHISKGILGLLNNKGTLELIVSHKIDEDTFAKIKEGTIRKYKQADSLDEIEVDDIDLSDLAFLISVGLVNIKVAYTVGVYHEKYGLVEDGYGNRILFSGSNNETLAALEINYESFETTLSWIANDWETQKLKHRIESFNTTWENKNDKLIVYDLPTALKRQIIKKINVIDTLERIEENTAYFNYSDALTVNFNFDFDINSWYKLRRWKKLIKISNTRTIVFNRLSKQDKKTIVETFKSYLKSNDVFCLVNDKLKELIYGSEIDLVESRKHGIRIKDENYFESTDFEVFKSEVNEHLDRKLRDPQVRAADHIVSLKRSMNFSVPGSGKTATVLAAYNLLKEKNEIEKLLVIGPKNCFKAWIDEAKIVLGLNANEIMKLNDVSDFTGKRLELKYGYSKSKIILVNISGTINGAGLLKKYIDRNVMVVYDEIHRLKRLDGQAYKATSSFVGDCAYRVSLTGTPLPNGYIDLYNQFDLVFGDYTRTYFKFFSHSLSQKDKKFNEEGKLSSDIATMMYPFYIRINKEDLCVPLPEPDEIIAVEENPSLIDKFFSSNKNRIGQLFRLMKIGVTPESNNILTETDVRDNKDFCSSNNFDVNLRTAKLTAFLELIKKIYSNGESVVVWLNFIVSINKVYELLKKEGYKVGIIYGATNQPERDEIIDAFNDGDIRILVTNPHTLAESVSLHKKCNNAIYLEMNYNLSQYLQSRDRIHRLGIDKNRRTNYYVFHSYYKGFSIDERIYNRLNRKGLKMYDTIEASMLVTKDEKEILQEIENTDLGD